MCRMWIKDFLNVNIINFEKVDKPSGSQKVDLVIDAFLAILMHILCGISPISSPKKNNNEK